MLNSTLTSVDIEWEEPCSNNSTILGYTIYLNDEILVENIAENFFVIENLQPDTIYKLVVVAVTDQGDGYKNK